MRKIAVLGGGGTGHAIAADLTLAGFEINLYEEPELKEKLNDTLERGGVELTGALEGGFAKVSKVTTDIGEALQDVETILVAVTAWRHERIAELCAPYLKDGQTIVIGLDNGGSLIFANVLQREGVKCDINIAGIDSNYYSCRLIGPAKVIVALPRRPKRIAAFPAKETDTVIKRLSDLRSLYHFVPGTNVLEVALSSNNIAIHLAGSLLNAGAIERSGGEFYLYRQGITPAILRCVEAVTQEREALFNALGYTISSSDMLQRVARVTEFPELDIFRGLIGPTSLQHRYITEDASTGQALMVSLGEMINVPTPVTKALVTLASTINQTDYLKEGRTVEKLGISGLSIDELNRFLARGSR